MGIGTQLATGERTWLRIFVMLSAAAFLVVGLWGWFMGGVHYPNEMNSDSGGEAAYWSFWGGIAALLAFIASIIIFWGRRASSRRRLVFLRFVLAAGWIAIICVLDP